MENLKLALYPLCGETDQVSSGRHTIDLNVEPTRFHCNRCCIMWGVGRILPFPKLPEKIKKKWWEHTC